MFEAIMYVLRTGIQWNALPRELGASSTVYDRFRLWEQQGVFERLWEAGLQEFDEVEGLEWEWQSLDGTQIKAQIARRRHRGQSGGPQQTGDQAEPIE